MKKAVLLIGFGGPDSPEAVKPFMASLMGGREPAPEVVARIQEKYRAIGGASPLLDITRAQARSLEGILSRTGTPARVYVAMRYWHPFIPETVEQMVRDGVELAAALSLSPYRSRVTAGAYEKGLKAALERAPGLRVAVAGDWYSDQGFIRALARTVADAIQKIPEGTRHKTALVFSAHSLPVEHVRAGDPYVDQLNYTVSAVLEQLPPLPWRLAFQSKGGRGEWLGPPVERAVEDLASEGYETVILIPAGFVADHVETLYDIDIALRNHARSLGLDFYRASCLNTSPEFIGALAGIALGVLGDMG